MSYARPSPIWSSPTASRLHPPRSHTPTQPGQSALYLSGCLEDVFSETTSTESYPKFVVFAALVVFVMFLL
jgi:hypothetical protein